MSSVTNQQEKKKIHTSITLSLGITNNTCYNFHKEVGKKAQSFKCYHKVTN